MPVARGAQRAPSPEPDEEPETTPARAVVGMGAGIAVAGAGAAVAHATSEGAGGAVTLTGRKAKVLYDYNKAEENEIELVENEIIGMIEILDEDWWQGTNSKGETGLFPSNYVEPIMGPEDEEDEPQHPEEEPDQEEEFEAPPPQPPRPGAAEPAGKTATAIYDYEASEENELSFPEGATIENIEFPDEDWWSGQYNGHEGLFPSNYVDLHN